ncbi:MAG: factor-independent urate hydroxylase [Euzebya sp.]
MTVQMGPNRYGKSGIRLAVVDRSLPTHQLTDLEIQVWLQGDYAAAHEQGDNSAVLPTDTMRGTCFALARDGIESVSDFGIRLARRFLDASASTTTATVTLVQFGWERVQVDGTGHPHSFRPAAGGGAVTGITLDRGGQPVVSGGVRGARVLKTTGSAFSGFLQDEFTTLPQTRDRIMATTIDAWWGTRGPECDHTSLAQAVPATMLAAFARHDDSESVQHTMYTMGNAVLDAHEEITWIRFLLPNEHHILSDLSPYGLDNPGVVFWVADRPFGVIEGTVAREGFTPHMVEGQTR